MPFAFDASERPPCSGAPAPQGDTGAAGATEPSRLLELIGRASPAGLGVMRPPGMVASAPDVLFVNEALERMSGRRGPGAVAAMLAKAALDPATACALAAQAARPVLVQIADPDSGAAYEAVLQAREGVVTLAVLDCTAARRQRDVFAELHHRIKNSLANAASLLKLQAARSGEPAVLDSLRQAADRIQAIADLHQVLYRFDSLDTVELGAYVREFCDRLSRSLLEGGRIRLEAVAPAFAAPFETAAPLGLILNELITNAVKHGYGPGEGGIIRVELRLDGPGLLLRVANDGRPLQGPPERAGSLGMRLVRSLAKQLNGELRIEAAPRGAVFEVRMPLPASRSGPPEPARLL